MRCIKTNLIQGYIDKAASEKEIETVVKHLAVCRECTARFMELQRRADEVKKTMNILAGDEVAIPGFIAPVGIPKVRAVNRIKRSIITLSAASVLICIVLAVLFIQKTRTSQQVVLVHAVDREINANQTAAKQQMVINMIDADGKVTSFP